MTHYSVLVALPGDTELADLDNLLATKLERYNENRDVPRYRQYEEGDPGNFWAVDGLREDGMLPAEGPVTWPMVVDAYNRKYHAVLAKVSTAVATGDEPDEEQVADGRMYVDPEDGRAYSWSTYNPESKWDWWVIGGRWSDHFKIKEFQPGLIFGNFRGTFGKPKTRGTCDGGPKRLLDLEAMRDKAATDANELYDEWEKLVAKWGPPTPWAELRDRATVAEEFDINEARRRYNEQPLVREAEQLHLTGFLDDPVEVKFGTTREEYVQQARMAAVPGYAYIDLDGEWHSPGRMGWFGASTDGPGEREAHKVEANAYIDSLDPDTVLVFLDFHI